MRRKLFNLLLICLLVTAPAFSVFAHDFQNTVDVADFNRKFEIVRWLVKYDAVAWKTTDLMLAGDKNEIARLGREWFCFQDKNEQWHAVYGKLENDRFEQIFHYVVDNSEKISRIEEQLNQSFLVPHARALKLAITKL